MTFSIINWNVDENNPWFVRLEDTGSAVSVELYLTQADAQAQENLQASGESSGYGASLEITLTNEGDAETPVSLFQEGSSWHLIVSGQNGDSTKIFKVKEFIGMDDISHAIYRNSSLIASRAAAEIDAHTHSAVNREISLKVHLPTLEAWDIVKLNSSRRGVNDLSQLADHRIVGTPDSLVSVIESRKYLELKR